MNFEINSGQLLQITGSNGSGKTTLLRVLAGLTSANCGMVTRKNIAQLHYQGHQTAVKNELTVKENLQFCYPKISQSDLLPVLERVGLINQIDNFTYQLSHGQKQRLALARLLLNKNALLWILDEPMTGLDQPIGLKLQQIFYEHISQRNGIIVFTTHQPLTLSDLSIHSVSLALS